LKEGDILATKEEKQRKQFAEKLLRIKGVDYDKWLDEKHKTVIQENQDLVMMALESVLDNGSNQDSSTSDNKNSVNTSNSDSNTSKSTSTVSNDNKDELVKQTTY
jgi:hypothetical protein